LHRRRSRNSGPGPRAKAGLRKEGSQANWAWAAKSNGRVGQPGQGDGGHAVAWPQGRPMERPLVGILILPEGSSGKGGQALGAGGA
jgi:hypothetical protein